MRNYNILGFSISAIAVSMALIGCSDSINANLSTDTSVDTVLTSGSVPMTKLTPAVRTDRATVFPIQSPDVSSYKEEAFSSDDKPVLKLGDYVPVETTVDGKPNISIEKCDTDEVSFYCSTGSLMLVQHSPNNIVMPNGDIINLTQSTNLEPWYEYTLNYIKDGVLYPTPWYFNAPHYLELGYGLKFARVNGDFCVYAEAFNMTNKIDNFYNCFKVNEDFSGSSNSESPVILSEQTFKHNVVGMSKDDIAKTNIMSFNTTDSADLDGYEYKYGYD